MRKERVKALKRTALALGVQLTKKGFRRLKKAYNRDRHGDVKTMVRRLVHDDAMRVSRLRQHAAPVGRV